MKTDRVRTILSLVMLVFLGGWPAILAAVATPVTTASILDSDTTVLYDGALGTLPGEQGFEFIAFPSGPTQTVEDGGTTVDTMAANAYLAGYFGRPALVPQLERTAGYTVTLAVQLLTESHASDNRAGFSVIVLSDNHGGAEPAWGIELAFWDDEIWAQDDGTQGGALFTHAEGVAVDTLTPRLYNLAIFSDTYTLWSDGSALLAGRLRDYGAFAGVPDPYETPNLIFLGDDTGSAAARFKINYVAVTTPAGKADDEGFQFLPLLKRP